MEKPTCWFHGPEEPPGCLVIVNEQLCHSENNLGLGRGPNLDKEIGSMTDPHWSVSQVEWCWLVINLPN